MNPDDEVIILIIKNLEIRLKSMDLLKLIDKTKQ